jgi:CheY-like chemotaxis protein
LDINLPGMDGVAALRILKARPETASIPVIAVTASATERDRRRGEAAGFHRYLTKPLKVADLVSALDALVAQPTADAG